MTNMIVLEGEVLREVKRHNNYDFFAMGDGKTVVMIRCYTHANQCSKLKKGDLVSVVGYLQSEEWFVDDREFHNLFVHSHEVKVKIE